MLLYSYGLTDSYSTTLLCLYLFITIIPYLILISLYSLSFFHSSFSILSTHPIFLSFLLKKIFLNCLLFSFPSLFFTLSGVSQVIQLEKLLAAGGTPDDIRVKIAKPTVSEEVISAVDVITADVAVVEIAVAESPVVTAEVTA